VPRHLGSALRGEKDERILPCRALMLTNIGATSEKEGEPVGGLTQKRAPTHS